MYNSETFITYLNHNINTIDNNSDHITQDLYCYLIGITQSLKSLVRF